MRDVVKEDSDGDSESSGYLTALEGESDDGEESHGDYVAEDGTEQLLDDNLLSPAATSSLSILLDLCYHQREIRYYF